MVDLALGRMTSGPQTRREEILSLQIEIRRKHEEAIQESSRLASRRAYHFGKLPVEIANTVFSMLIDEDHTTAIGLSQVCKSWRETVLGTPAFWRTLVLSRKHPKRKVKLWRERSGGRIRHLIFLEEFTTDPSVLEALSTISTKYLQTITLQTFPLRHLPCHLPSVAPEIMQPFRGWPADIPLSISGDLRWQQDSITFYCKMLQLPRCLHPVDWYQLSDSFTDLESITLGSFEHNDWPHLLWLLHRNPHLIHLDISSFSPMPFTPIVDRDVPPAIVLSELSSFHMTQSSPDRILPRVELPSLKTLQLNSCPGNLETTLHRLAQCTSSSLTVLSIKYTAFASQAMIRTLEAMTVLQTLQLVSVSKAASVVLDALARPLPIPDGARASQDLPPTHVLCPALRHLDCSQNPDIKGGPLIRLVKLRLGTSTSTASQEGDENALSTPITVVQPLLSLNIDGCPAVDPEVLPWLREKVASVSCVYMSKKAAGWKR